MSKKYILDFKIDQDDYRNTMICMTFGIQKWKRVAILVTWCVFAALLVLNITKIIHLSNVVYTCSLLVTVIIAAAFITMEINIYKYKKIYKSGKNIRREIVVEDKGCTFKNRSTEESGFNPWNEISRIQELEKYFVIGVNKNDAIILPKRAFKNDNEIDGFRELVYEKIEGRFMPL